MSLPASHPEAPDPSMHASAVPSEGQASEPAPPYDYGAPFAHTQPTMPSARMGNPALWAVLGAVGAVALLGVGYLGFQSLRDPYRTLDNFPAEKYLSDYQGVVGNRFRAELIVDAELGGSFERGRILTFRDADSNQALAVLVPPELARISFSKGQRYRAEIEVGPGGLIQAYGLKKY